MPVDELEDPLDFSLLKPMEDDDEDHCPDPKDPGMVIFEMHAPSPYPNGYNPGWTAEHWYHEGGAADYEHGYGCGLEYHCQDAFLSTFPVGKDDPPDHPLEGVYVLEGMTLHFTRGDGWMTDDDCDVYFDSIRPATLEEIADAWNGADFWASDPYDNVA